MGLLGWLGSLFGQGGKTVTRGPSYRTVENVPWEDVRDVCMNLYLSAYKKFLGAWGESLTNKMILNSVKGTQAAESFSMVTIMREPLDRKIESLDEDSRTSFIIRIFSELMESIYGNAVGMVGETVGKELLVKAYVEEFGSFLSPDGKMAFSVLPKSLLQEIREMAESQRRENSAAIDFAMGLLKGRKLPTEAHKLVKKTEKADVLELLEDDFIEAYLQAERAVISSTGGYDTRMLRSEVSRNVKTGNLGVKMRLLLSPGWGEKVLPVQELFSIMSREMFSIGMEKEKIEGLIKDLTRGTLLEGVEIKKSGAVFDPINQKFIYLPEAWSARVAEDGIRTVKEMLSHAQNLWGKKIGDDIISKSYFEMKSRYYAADFKSILRSLPRGVLEQEKISMMSKEELESLSRELSRGEEIKEEFLNVMAHELKTPLIPIIGYLSMMVEDRGIPEATRGKLQVCLDAAKREENLVNDLLDISKLEAGSMKFDKRPLKPRELVSNAVMGFELRAREKGIVFAVEAQELPEIAGDEKRLTQVIQNFLTNAVKFTEKGEVRVLVYGRGEEIVVSVKDTGKGIKKENLPKLFTKFFQESGDKKYAGTGLGLAICKEIIEAHGGKIWAESEEGKGSTFGFSLPVTPKGG